MTLPVFTSGTSIRSISHLAPFGTLGNQPGVDLIILGGLVQLAKTPDTLNQETWVQFPMTSHSTKEENHHADI